MEKQNSNVAVLKWKDTMSTKLDRPLPVVLSFTEALDDHAARRIVEAGLDIAIFFLGCDRKFLTRNTARQILAVQLPKQREDVTEDTVVVVRRSIFKAHLNERVIWRQELGPRDALIKLNTALERAGIPNASANIPAGVDNRFLQYAIEQMHGTRVQVIAR